MYSLDVNFLKDRPEYKLNKNSRFPKSRFIPTSNWSPLYLGLAAGLFLPAVVGGVWLLLQNQNSQLENKIAETDAELNRLGIETVQLKKVQEETTKTKGENQALASVFNQIRPWSATLQDLGDRIPAGVQIESIKQIAASAPQPSQSAPKPNQPAPNSTASTPQPNQSSPNFASEIEITGMASSFSGVNDFVLTLQQSPFFKPTDTKIITAELVDSPTIVVAGATALVKPPQFVRYTIQSSLSDIPASELIAELERKGTLGLVTRIRTLQQTGVRLNP